MIDDEGVKRKIGPTFVGKPKSPIPSLFSQVQSFFPLFFLKRCQQNVRMDGFIFRGTERTSSTF